jgi:predicted enzyme related to lactoylglutathione lyase
VNAGLTAPGIASITIDAADPYRLAGFWSALLGLAVTEVGPDYAELAPLYDGGPTLLFIQVPEGKVVKNRVHLDLSVDDVAASVEQALTLGASEAQGELAGPFAWKVLHDPEGNEFCLCPRESST